MEKQQRVALITGGGTGIGRSTALMLAKRGVRVAINYSRSKADAENTLQEIVSLGGKGIVVRADVSDESSVKAMVEETVSRLGRLDILVNNAGATTFIPLDDLDALQDAHWDQALSVNVKGNFYCSRAAAKAMRETGGGSIVNIASVAGITGRGSSIAYCASKAAVISLTKSLAQVLAPEIRVNAVAPGYVETRWTKGQEEFREKHLQSTPLKRLAGPDDPAVVATALALDFTHVTGETIVVDGGAIL